MYVLTLNWELLRGHTKDTLKHNYVYTIWKHKNDWLIDQAICVYDAEIKAFCVKWSYSKLL